VIACSTRVEASASCARAGGVHAFELGHAIASLKYQGCVYACVGLLDDAWYNDVSCSWVSSSNRERTIVDQLAVDAAIALTCPSAAVARILVLLIPR
jgi:hypothetical protein